MNVVLPQFINDYVSSEVHSLTASDTKLNVYELIEGADSEA